MKLFNNVQFREVILRPTLMALQKWRPEVEELMIGTMAHESKGGTYLVQENGPAVGPFEMEPVTHDDIWLNYLPNQPKLSYDLMTVCGFAYKPKFEVMKYHLVYAVCMARIDYLRIPEPIPKDLQSQALYWKNYYNTKLGKGTPEEYIQDYLIFTGAKNESVRERKGKA